MNEREFEPCMICEEYMVGADCGQSKCPVGRMKRENARLKQQVSRLKLEMSYMSDPMSIGDNHEMGAW